VNAAVQQVLGQLLDGAPCADRMAALCRGRAVELTAVPVPAAVAMIKTSVEAVTRALAAPAAAAPMDALATLRHLLAHPALRAVAIKAARLRSLATLAIEAAPRERGHGRDAAVASVLRVLRDAGVCVTTGGSLEAQNTPLTAALQHSLLGAAAVLLDAGADINQRSVDGSLWPMAAALVAASDAGMAWLLERGASLAVVNARGRTVAHLLAMLGSGPYTSSSTAGTPPCGGLSVSGSSAAGSSVGGPSSGSLPSSSGGLSASASFGSRWLRRVITAEPSLLEARDKAGQTPLLAAAGEGCETGVAALLELGADVSATDDAGDTALSCGCASFSLPVVRRLIAASAAGAGVLPPGSRQARRAASMAVLVALSAERGCGGCAARCGGTGAGNCADGLDILRAVLAAGVREAEGSEGRSLACMVVSSIARDAAPMRASAAHALSILQALQAGGVDVLSRGPLDARPILHTAAVADAAAVVHWLVSEAGAPVEERNTSGLPPLPVACTVGAWTAVHALLDCGARVDVQSTDAVRFWPVQLVAQSVHCGSALLRRMLAADRDSLARCAANDVTAIHLAAAHNPDALPLLLGSGLPHLAEAVNRAAACAPAVDGRTRGWGTPLHGACRHSNWDAALALLAADARVDIAGDVGGKTQTVAQWASDGAACKHRGLKTAIAERAREHAAQASRARAAAKGSPRGISGAPSPAAPALSPARAAAAVHAGQSEARSPSAASYQGLCAGAGAPLVVACGLVEVDARPSGAGKPTAKHGHGGVILGRAGEASDGSETPPEGAVAAQTGPPIATAGLTAVSVVVFPARITCNLPEDPSALPAADVTSSSPALDPPAHCLAESAYGSSDFHESATRCHDASQGAGSINTCEPSAECGFCVNTCEPGEAGMSTEEVASTPSAHGDELRGAASLHAATASLLLAALHSEGTSVAAARQHLAALTELARDPAGAAALQQGGVTAAICAALSRHGASVNRAAAALMAALSDSAGDGEDEL
jgi:ankyrin repeat protein